SGQFQYRPSLADYGPVTIKARVREWSASYGQYLYSASWTTLDFTYGVSPALTFDQIHLVNDTGPDDEDKITRDPTIAGALLGDRAAYAAIEWDFTGDTVA